VAESRRGFEESDPDTIDPGAIDWQHVQPVKVDIDPALLEQIRGRRLLRQMTLRIGVEQIDEARRVAAETGLRYQAVLRRWLAEGASIARTKRLHREKGAKLAKHR
jgi:hypothetical protein